MVNGPKKSFLKEFKKFKVKTFDNIHKDSVTTITSIEDGDKIVTTGTDGFIKSLSSTDFSIKKAFFVC